MIIFTPATLADNITLGTGVISETDYAQLKAQLSGSLSRALLILNLKPDTKEIIIPYALMSSTASIAHSITPSFGSVSNLGPITGSATHPVGYSFASAAEFNNFINAVSGSFQQFNNLLVKLRSAGIIT